MDFFDKSDIESDIEIIKKTLASNIFAFENSRHLFFRAAFIEVLIHLRDLMFKTERFAIRISFTDDVLTTPKIKGVTPEIKDVSDLIKAVRDAMCHPDIEHHYLPQNNSKASFNIAFGKGGFTLGGVAHKSEYDDDVCFFFGIHKIYLNRHIIRAFEEAKQKLLPLI